ncbi:glycosyltransferase, partial [Verrucomicrobia bacterium]|nr:glycosyltransferase [Verrucomicrobiota bacterium]
MTTSPKLSVIMPVKNAEATVEKAISSILNCSFGDFEFIIVDDASTDESVDRIRSFNDSRIHFQHSATPGLCHTLNQAVAACSAPFIARMDADDICYPDRFKNQLSAIDEHNWDVVGGRVSIVDRQGKTVSSFQRYERWINNNQTDQSIRAFRFVESPLANPTTLAKRVVYTQPFVDGPLPEDYDFWLQAMRKDFRFGKIDEVVLDWIDDPSRTTRNDPRYSPEAFDRCRRKHLLLGPLIEAPEVDIWGAGQTGKPWVRWIQSENKQVRHLIDVSPKKIGQTIHGAKVIAPNHLPAPDNTPLIVAVGAEKAREQ